MMHPPTSVPGFEVWTYRLRRFYVPAKAYAERGLPGVGTVTNIYNHPVTTGPVDESMTTRVLVLWGNGYDDDHRCYRFVGVENIEPGGQFHDEHIEAMVRMAKDRMQRLHWLNVREVRFPVIESISIKELEGYD